MGCHQHARILVVFLSLWLVSQPAWGQAEADKTAPTIELQPKHILKLGHKPYSFSFSRDGKRFASNDGKSAKIWETATWKQVGAYTEEIQFVHSAILSPDGQLLAFTRDSGETIHLLDVASSKVLRTLSGHTSSVYSQAFSPDGKAFASIAFRDGVKLWDVATGKELGHLPVKPKGSQADERLLVFSPDGGTLAVATDEGIVRLMDVAKRKEVRQLAPPDEESDSPRGLAFSPDGRFLAVGSGRINNVTVWDLDSRKPGWQLQWPEVREHLGPPPRDGKPPGEPPAPGVDALAFAPDSRSLLVACSEKRVRVCEIATGRLRFKAEGRRAFLAAPPASFLFATSSGKEDLRGVFIWDWRTCVPCRPPATPANLEKAWQDLCVYDAALAFQHMQALLSRPKEAVAFLDKRLPTVSRVKPSVVEARIQELDHDRFEVRERARQRLAELGEIARTALVGALAANPSLEARKRMKELLEVLDGPLSGDRLRLVRTIEVMETIGSPESRLVLKRLTEGDPVHLLTREAKAALDRLNSD